jgi:hypothetical protein
MFFNVIKHKPVPCEIIRPRRKVFPITVKPNLKIYTTFKEFAEYFLIISHQIIAGPAVHKEISVLSLIGKGKRRKMNGQRHPYQPLRKSVLSLAGPPV